MEKAFFIEDVLKNKGNDAKLIQSNLMQRREGTFGELRDRLDFIWNTNLRPKFFYFLAIAAIILSVQLVIGELIILFKLNFSLLDLIPQFGAASKVVNILLSIILLMYLSLCVYYGLFNLKFTSYYELHSN